MPDNGADIEVRHTRRLPCGVRVHGALDTQLNYSGHCEHLEHCFHLSATHSHRQPFRNLYLVSVARKKCDLLRRYIEQVNISKSSDK